jgi:citrate lyase subunit beta/citryl-CoA lyase
VDLEDAVAVEAKVAARELTGSWLTRQQVPPAALWVRVNTETMEEDVAATAGVGLAGVVLPKAAPNILARLDRLLAGHERRLGLAIMTFAVIPLIETAGGLLECAAIAEAPRVVRLGLGEVDLAADLRVRLTDAGEEMRPLRMCVVVASAAAGIGAPIGPVATDVLDLDGLQQSTRVLADLGFRARAAIHPAQVTVINEMFTPTTAETRAARELISAFEAAGGGVMRDEHGRMVDRAAVRSAYETLGRAGNGPDCGLRTSR